MDKQGKRDRGTYGAGRVYQPTYKSANGTVKTVQKFYIQFYDANGKQIRESTDAATRSEAQDILTQKIAAVKQSQGISNTGTFGRHCFPTTLSTK
jgi:hypothetical protein